MDHNLFVFDLDYTLWDANGSWCDCTYPPYKRINEIALDAYGTKIQLYPSSYHAKGFRGSRFAQ